MNFTFDLNIISDLHKDARGYRPGEDFWAFLAVANPEQKQAVWDELLVELRATMAQEEQREQEAIGDFERGIRHNQALGAEDRQTAIRWMLDGVLADHDLVYGGEYACYIFNLPYRYQAELDPIVSEILESRHLGIVNE